MNAKELRIGNLVTLDNRFSHPSIKGVALKVAGTSMFNNTDKGSIYLNHLKNEDNIVIPAFAQYEEYVKPIPLTEEILLKCGLVKSDENFLLGCYELISIRHDSVWDVWVVWLKNGVIAKFKYLHQLQNFYNALTGEELTIKL